MPEPADNASAAGPQTDQLSPDGDVASTDSSTPIEDAQASKGGDAENVLPFVVGSGSKAAPPSVAAAADARAGGKAPLEPFDVTQIVDRKAVEDLIREAQRSAQGFRDWYDQRASAMGRISRQLRLWAVGLGVAGGLCPLLPGNLVDALLGASAEATISASGFVLFALAAAAVLLDQAFGYSSSWMRSRLAELELGRLIRLFTIDAGSALARAPDALSGDAAKAIVDRLHAFAADVDNVVVRETETWISEFKAGLLQIQQTTRSGGRTNGNDPGKSNAG